MSFFLYLVLLTLTYVRPIEAFAPELVEYRPILILSMLTLLVGTIEAIQSGDSAARSRYMKLLFGFMVVIALSLIANGWAGGAVAALIDFSATAVLFLLTLFNVKSMKRLRTTCAVLVMSLVILAANGAISFHTGFMANDLVLRQNSENEDSAEPPEEGVVPAEDTSGAILWRVRSLGFLRDPNDFGQAIVVVLPMLAVGYRRRALVGNVIRIGLPAAMLLYGMYLTHSRGALLGIGAMLFFVLYRKLGVAKTVAMMAIVASAALAANFTGGRAYTSQEESAGGRIAAWSEGLTMLGNHPVLGVGYHAFTDHHNYTAHNSFVLCFSELGLVGYWIWIGMLVLVVREISLVADHAPEGTEERTWANLLRASLFGFLTCAIFLSRAYEPGLFILLALCICCVHCARLHTDPDWTPVLRPVNWRLATTIVTIGSIGLVYVVVLMQNTYGR